ncbi:RNA-directed DNA polymerase, eukaryota [Artemisia annua]|uniref:RNA-directed DNA polymerase, eukaryota n=1 Tax=Artemisia annua TaxID=35608 RepID=A0A2U1NJN0_ARTAN|nr:RNA-directed DNA polymerase, eukaryota [Artemisia annua]
MVDQRVVMARGRSGGLVTMWDPSVFAKNRIWCGDNYIIVEDRFLISADVLQAHSDVQVTVLDRVWSDYNPILLHCKKTHFGLIPFKIFLSWFGRNDFDDVVKQAWENLSVANDGSIKPLNDKLKGLKVQLKLWYSCTKEAEHS